MRTISVIVCLLLLLLVFVPTACKKAEPENAEAPPKKEDLPAIVIYPTGRVIERAFGEDGSFQIRMVTSADRDNILLFYNKNLPRRGWRKVTENKQEQYLAIYRRNNETIHLSLLPTDNDTQSLHVIHYSKE
ncbi:MAG TPA: hypothetical protein PKW95_02080 [bacterium]|nr:hypothetical protein [bacterium]